MNITSRHEALDGKIVQFEKHGVENTEDVFRIARLRADELGIETILVASIGKNTAVSETEVFWGKRWSWSAELAAAESIMSGNSLRKTDCS